ncbi:MAG TPA: hypothetical protein VG253_23205 [Streptosporangiaceae bacterium]|jgi:hypothetical protein|nr:hypothetical protein [Streptosporangiaceae bacterium]
MTTDPVTPAATHQATIDAALLVLKSMGLSLNDLTTAPGHEVEFCHVMHNSSSSGRVAFFFTVNRWSETTASRPSVGTKWQYPAAR